MSDIKLTWDVDLMEAIANFDSATNDFEADDGLSTAVIISLFTDARAKIDDPLPNSSGNLRGWWGDLTSEKTGDSVGSKIWLYERSKIDNDTINGIKREAEAALAWMIEEKLAKKVTAQVERYEVNSNHTIAMRVEITKPDGTVLPFKFEGLWEGTA